MKKLFIALLSFAILYNGYRYFFPWDGNKPMAPFYISILKDLPWALLAGIGLYSWYREKKTASGRTYHSGDSFKTFSWFFIFSHLFLLGVAVGHLSHKNPIDIFQRDIKNVQYIVLPALFPFLIKKEKDIADYMYSIIGLGFLVSVFAFITYFFVPSFTWDGAALATFQSPICFGFFVSMLFLIILSMILLEKNNSILWLGILCLFYGAILISVSFAAVLTALAGTAFLIYITKPTAKYLLKIGSYLGIISILFYGIGLYDPFLQKVDRSYSEYNTSSLTYEAIPREKNKKSLMNSDEIVSILTKPYHPVSDIIYQSKGQYTTFTGRLIGLGKFYDYVQSANFLDLLLGDFSLKNYMEYDNTYFYFIKNDGIVITVLLFTLLCGGFLTGLKKYHLFMKIGNVKMAGLSLGIATFLLTSMTIQFNLSYYIIIYPINFITYFLLTLIFFMNPSENGKYFNNRFSLSDIK